MCLYVRLEIDSRLRDGVALAVRAKVRDAAATASVLLCCVSPWLWVFIYYTELRYIFRVCIDIIFIYYLHSGKIYIAPWESPCTHDES
jgi:hypothetical protein